jgi:hypothetical protein
MAHKQNYMERMELVKQRRIEAGLVSDRFPKVSGMVILMTYYQRGKNPVLMKRTVNVFPTSFAYFHMECMIKGCVDGGFDLTATINDLIKNHKKLSKGKLTCKGKLNAVDCDHASIDYEIQIQYQKNSQHSG